MATNRYPRNHLYLTVNEAIDNIKTNSRSTKARGTVSKLNINSLKTLKELIDKPNPNKPDTVFMAGKSGVEFTIYSESSYPTSITITGVDSILKLRNKIENQIIITCF